MASDHFIFVLDKNNVNWDCGPFRFESLWLEHHWCFKELQEKGVIKGGKALSSLGNWERIGEWNKEVNGDQGRRRRWR